MDSTSFELTVEQQFHLRLVEDSAHQMSCEQTRELLIQLSRQLMVKDNVIRDLLKRGVCNSI